MEFTEIELKQKNLREICVFGHIEYSCPYISPERINHCVNGRGEECEHYPKQLAKILEKNNIQKSL